MTRITKKTRWVPQLKMKEIKNIHCRIDSQRIYLSFYLKKKTGYVYSYFCVRHSSVRQHVAKEGHWWHNNQKMNRVTGHGCNCTKRCFLGDNSTFLIRYAPFSTVWTVNCPIYLEIIIPTYRLQQENLRNCRIWVILNIEQGFKALPVLFKHFIDRLFTI